MAHPSNRDYEQYLSVHLRNVYAPDSGMSKLRKAYHVANIVPRLRKAPESPILEVGPGFGEMLGVLVESEYRQLHAVDISPEVVQHIQGKYPSVVCRHIDDLQKYLLSRPGYYHNILMIDVIEHLPKDQVVPVLRSARLGLVPGGRLIVQTVNMGSPMAGNVLFSDFTHVWGYTELSLKEVLVLAGFSTVEVFGYRFPHGFVGAVRGVIRKLSQFLCWLHACANGMLRLSTMDPALVVVASTDGDVPS